MTIFLDLAGSFVIRASMVTVMLGLTVTMNNALFETTQQTNTRATLVTVSDVMYYDLNNAVKDTVLGAFTTVQSQRVVFVADTSVGEGRTATITYDASEVDPSTGLRKLYRQTGSQRVLISKNLINVQFQYFDADGHVTTSASAVDAIRVKLVAKVEGVTEGFTTSLNDFKVVPPNLN